ncbi:MAG: MBL fold metallo-hydrolase [Planctomycetota bacterium]|jgi:glyoxylase-like metal-dependent hydrolase (beta-lactamase superfamily II)
MIANNKNLSRRLFLHRMGAGTIGLAAGSIPRTSPAETPNKEIIKLTLHLSVYQGHINVGILRDGDKALLIDCGDGSVTAALGELGIKSIDRIIFTHHHRDQACGAQTLAAAGAGIGVPAAERDHFDNVSAYWNNPRNRWHLYNLHPHHLMLAEAVRVDRTFSDGDMFDWGPAQIRVIATPGHTDGSISYLIRVDGRKVIFSGDTIADRGKLWDIHSLQKGCKLEKRTITDYHGFLGARTELIESLKRINNANPETLVPSHGRIMTNPKQAIDKLLKRIEVCYDKYVSISALRHYFPELFAEYAGRKHHMPINKGITPPPCLRHIGNTWVIISKNKAAFVIDCGNDKILGKIVELVDKGDIKNVEGLWVTHYHNDHVNAVPQFQKTFDCPCITDRAVARVITDPLAWRLPCISPSIVRVDRPTNHAESWQWNEFKMTAYYFPGQTLYHSGLLVEADGLRMFFAGDSFSMSGIDDYATLKTPLTSLPSNSDS